MIFIHPDIRTFMKRRFLLVIPLAAVAGLAFCERERPVTDPAKPIHARAGKPFTLTLSYTPSMGYHWVRAERAAGVPLVLVDSGVYMSRVNRKALGGRGTRHWTFRPSRAGEAVIPMILVPPSKTPETSDTTRFRVIVR